MINDFKFKIKRIGMDDIESIKMLFLSVFTTEPWNDDWSDLNQLNLFLKDLIGQNNSLTYGIYEDSNLIGVSMGHIRHWFSGTEYYIDELCIKKEKQGNGIGSLFLEEIEKSIKELGMSQIFLLTEKDVPAYEFYKRKGFYELTKYVAFAKEI